MFGVLLTECARVNDFEQNVFVMDDVIAAAALQSRHLRNSDLPLPVVATFCGQLPATKTGRVRKIVSYDVWANLPGRKFIFCGPRLTANMVNMASRANGRIYIDGFTSRFDRMAPDNALCRAQQQAIHWMGALETAIKDLPEPALTELLVTLDIPESEYRRFIYRCTDRTYRIIQQHEASDHRLKTTRLRDREVVETQHGWVCKRTGAIVCNAILRIDEILCRQEDDATFYRGRILFAGQEIPFCESQVAVDKDPFRWMKQKLISEDKGILISARQWSKDAVELAQRFHPPVLRKMAGSFGWRNSELALVLPNFTLGRNGKVTEEEQPLFDDLIPARTLRLYCAAPHFPRLTLDTPNNRIFWATAACLAANIIAPTHCGCIAGIGLIGPGAVTIGQMTAKAFGCADFPVPTRKGSPGELADTLDEAVRRHAWPLVIRAPRGTQRQFLNFWLNCPQYLKNCVVPELSPLMAEVVGVHGLWRFVVSDEWSTDTTAIVEQGPRVLSGWLQRLAKNGFWPQFEGHSLARGVLKTWQTGAPSTTWIRLQSSPPPAS